MSDQIDLEFDPRKLARREDPMTSKSAAAQARDFRSDHHRTIVDCLERNGCMTSWEIHLETNLDYHAVARRIKELREAGFVSASRLTRTGRTNRQCTVWCYERKQA